MSPAAFTRVTLSLAAVAALAIPSDASALELRVLCSNGLRAVLQELVPKFEQATAHRVIVTYDVSAELKRRIAQGAPFDVAVLTPALIDEAIGQGTIARDSRIVLARSAMAVAIRSGTPRADIRTVEAFTATVLAAKSIAYAREGAAGVFFADLVQRLGLADRLKSRITLASNGTEVSALVARGGAELGVLPVSEILGVGGVELLGTFPAELQGYVTMVGGVSAATTQRQLAGEFIRFLMAPASLPVLEQKGMQRP